jgi:hypothetical protein
VAHDPERPFPNSTHGDATVANHLGPHAAVPAASRSAWWSYAAILALGLVVGLPTIRADNYFLGDDFGLVHHLHALPPDRLLTYFISDWTEGIYGVTLDELRPLLALSYWLDSRLFGATTAQGYHATNVVLHVVNGLLVLAIARAVAPGQTAAALFAGVLFVLMPSHAEPVAWISGRVDSLAALFYFGAFLCFIRFRQHQRRTWLMAALVIFACGLFAKQSLVTLPVLILAYDLVYARTRENTPAGNVVARFAPHLPFFLLALAYLWLRQTLFGNAVREDLLTAAAFKEFAVRQSFYVRKLLPIATGAPPVVRALAAALTLIALAVCSRWFVARSAFYRPARRHLVFFGLIWYAITIAPMVVTYASPRHLYLTSAGISIALAALILPDGLGDDPRRRVGRVSIVTGLIALYGVALTWNISAWVANGIESQRFAAALPHMIRSVPRGSVVLLSIPEWRRDGFFWSWGLPFALQRPFLPEDLYAQFTIIERPPIYCCPPDQWWAAKAPVLRSLLAQSGPATYIAATPGTPGSLELVTRTVDGPALKSRLERALGKPVESITAGDVNELARVLFEQGEGFD